MIECPATHPSLPGLFDPQVPNHPVLWAVLEGRHAGQALVDSLENPTQCVLRTDAVLTYGSRGVSQDFLAEAIDRFKQTVPIWLVRTQDAPPAPEGKRCLERLEFSDLDPYAPHLADLRHNIPAGHEIRSIDRALIERCLWRDDMAFFCGSLDNFFQNAYGLCLMAGDEIIVEAYASALGNGYAEIGAITHEPFRGRGYAPITVATLIEALEGRGFHSYWSCDTENQASARVARKLGFRSERPYEIWGYKPPAE